MRSSYLFFLDIYLHSLGTYLSQAHLIQVARNPPGILK